MRSRLAAQSGLTLIEVMVAAAILLIVIVGFMAFQQAAIRSSDHVEDRAFAIARAVSMLEELEAYVEGGAESHAQMLDDFDDGSSVSPMLTTLEEADSPDDELSGNERAGDSWKYHRRISVSKLTGVESRDVRLVQVTVFATTEDGPDGRVLAQLSRVVRTIGSYLPPTQVVDVYALALENVPGWWVNMSTIRPLVENAFNDMEAVNPGLEFRIHWITRLAYGRDPYYAPYVNMTRDASQRVPDVYWYPGLIDDSGFVYYSAPRIGGRVNVDGRVLNTDTAPGYTLADQFNHARRYPEARELFEARKAAGLEKEPTLRLLLDDMAMRPDLYRNALIVNLHGELLPLPPVRNYSDPAKDPLRYPRVRAVTHPERLRVRGYDDVVLRVYAWVTDPDRAPGDDTLKDPIIVRIKGVRAAGSAQITRIAGNSASAYRRVTEDTGAVVTYEGGDTVIRLPRTPLRHGANNDRGLTRSARLYGWEYIPCPVSESSDFSRDLATPGTGPKNTARWIIRVPGDVVGDHRVVEVQTRIGPEPGEGATEDPFNVSRSWIWIDTALPPSEQAQFLGDPRHLPYADIKQTHGYNWYFRAVGEGYGGFERTTDGWAVDHVDVDVPRYFAWWRDALIEADTIFTTMNGFSFFYIGIGGELGSDEPNGYPDGLPLNDGPYGGGGNKTVFVSEIHHATRLVASRGGSWYSRYWLGELFPDAQYETWRAQGNLPVGRGGFVRETAVEVSERDFGFDRRRRTDRYGASSFFNAVGSSRRGPFNHLFESRNTARATRDGELLASTFNLNTPPKMSAYRPFTVDAETNYPPEWKEPEYARTRLRSDVRRVLYDADRPRSAASSGLMEIRDEREGRSGFFVMNGLSPAGVSGTAFMGRYAAITLMQGFMTAGEGVDRPGRVPQLPRVEILKPAEDDELVDPQAIEVVWQATWRRWDGARYTPYYPESFVETLPVSYVVKYSVDGGHTWKHALDDSPATPGERPSPAYLLGGTQFTWDVSGMPAGDFLLRVEAYRQGIPLHYSYHVVRQNIRR